MATTYGSPPKTALRETIVPRNDPIHAMLRECRVLIFEDNDRNRTLIARGWLRSVVFDGRLTSDVAVVNCNPSCASCITICHNADFASRATNHPKDESMPTQRSRKCSFSSVPPQAVEYQPALERGRQQQASGRLALPLTGFRAEKNRNSGIIPQTSGGSCKVIYRPVGVAIHYFPDIDWSTLSHGELCRLLTRRCTRYTVLRGG